MISREIKPWLVECKDIIPWLNCLNAERPQNDSRHLHSRPFLTFWQNVRHLPKIPYSKSKNLRQLLVSCWFGDIDQPVYASGRREWLFGQDGCDYLIDFITCIDLLVDERRVFWGPELCLMQLQCSCGICHGIGTKRIYKIFMYYNGWHRLQL
jgi:hypothetical protein